MRFCEDRTMSCRPTLSLVSALCTAWVAAAVAMPASASSGLTFKRGEAKVVVQRVVDASRVPQTASPSYSRAIAPGAFFGLDDNPMTCPGHYLGCAPAMPSIAVSPKGVLEGVESSFALYDTGGHLQPGWPKRADAFFGIPKVCDRFDPLPVAPHALYDWRDRRYWIMIDQTDGRGHHCPRPDLLWVAVSRTADPNGAWSIYAFDHYHGGLNGIGMDNRAFYFSVNYAWGDYWTAIFGASKAAMEAGAALDAAHGFTHIALNGTPLDRIMPALMEGPAGFLPPVEYFANTFTLLFGGGGCVTPCSGAALWAMAGGDTATPSLSGIVVPTDSYVAPPRASDPGCHRCISSFDTSVSTSPVYRGGALTFALETRIDNRTQTVPGIYWLQFKPQLNGAKITSAPLAQSGRVFFQGDRAAAYAALMPDASGNLVMVFDTMSSTLNPSVMWAVHRATDPPGTFGRPIFLARGAAPDNQGPYAVWGWYSAIATDGEPTNHIWIASELTRSDGDWTTAIGRVWP
jgi:hypothetical protein